MRKILLAAALTCFVGVSAAQTVTVPNDFATIQSAIDSFTSGGLNFGIAGANVIQIDAAQGPYDEAVYIFDNPDPVEDLTLTGINGLAVIQVRSHLQRSGLDGFLIQTFGNYTIENIAFVPSTTSAFTDDMVFIDVPGAGDLVVTFNNCVFTAADAAGQPVVKSYTEALTDHTANISKAVGDDLMTVATDAGENTSLYFNDCVFSHSGAPAGGADGIVDVSRKAVTGNPSYRFFRCIFSYIPRYGVQASGFGEPGNPAGHTTVFDGDATTRTLLTNGARAVQSFFGPDRGLISFNQTNVLNFTERAVSLGATLTVSTATDSIFANSGLGFVLGHDDTWATTTMTRVTLDNLATGFLVDVGGASANHGSVILRDSIISDSGVASNDTVISTYGVGPNGTWTFDIDNSAVVTAGNEAIGTVGVTGFESLGAGIVSGSPVYLQTASPTATDFYDVQSGAYAGAATASADLGGGADYVGGVPASVRDWALY